MNKMDEIDKVVQESRRHLLDKVNRLEEEREYFKSNCDVLLDMHKSVERECERLRRERDKAVEDLNIIRKETNLTCYACRYVENFHRPACVGCDYNDGDNWQWRGLEE